MLCIILLLLSLHTTTEVVPPREKSLFGRWAEHLEDQEVGTLIKGGTDRHMLDLTVSTLIDSHLEEMPL